MKDGVRIALLAVLFTLCSWSWASGVVSGFFGGSGTSAIIVFALN